MNNANKDLSLDVNQALLYKYDSKLQADRVSLVDADVGFDLSLDAEQDTVGSKQWGPFEVTMNGSDETIDVSRAGRLAIYGKPSFILVQASPFADDDVWYELKNVEGAYYYGDVLAKRIRFKASSQTATPVKFHVLLGS